MNTKQTTLILAVVLWAAAASTSLAITYTTLDDPLSTRGTDAIGISGNNIVGDYLDDAAGHGFLYNGSTYTTLDNPSQPLGTEMGGISDNNIVATFFDSNPPGNGTHGFLYNGTSYTTLDDPLSTWGTYAAGVSGNNVVGTYNSAARIRRDRAIPRLSLQRQLLHNSGLPRQQSNLCPGNLRRQYRGELRRLRGSSRLSLQRHFIYNSGRSLGNSGNVCLWHLWWQHRRVL